MGAEPDNLVLEHLRAIRADVDGLKEGFREMLRRQSETLIQLATLRREQAGDAEHMAHVEARLDRYGERLERVERRLELVD
ncbi:hypothetical protein FACS1894205_6110 [Alphaproteobacteria bacterium]|nr:hypothetical protein FACS1894205_6110 [Alphaproteobacteria bacterium]